MRKAIHWSVLGAMFTVAIVLAQSESDYQVWMKSIAASNGAMQKSLEAKNGAAAAMEAGKLEGLFKQVEGFWAKRNAADAVDFAKRAQTIASSVEKSAAAGNLDQASTEAKTMGAACGGCHMAHRERTDSGFKIK